MTRPTINLLVKLLVLAIATSALGALTAAPASAASPQPPIGAASGVLVELETGKVLWSKEHASVRAPASLTKIMTALVVLENAKLDDMAPITGEARAVDGGRMYAEVGWNFSVEELLWGLLLQSGNDAAVALAQKVGGEGGYARFVEMMNAKAVEIGTQSTAFKNPHGLDEVGHVSTARDLA
ncbi:MAG: D-alanyl-D-alanine carboxypeptidase family protein, partial [Acidimicrobiia bacterium]